jgi:carbon storage regulator
MLVLTRKAGEVIVIGDDVRVTLLEIQGGRVRLGIAAPKGIPVNRQEVQDRHAGDPRAGAIPACV